MLFLVCFLELDFLFSFSFCYVLFSIYCGFFHFAHINHVQKSLHCFPFNNILFFICINFPLIELSSFTRPFRITSRSLHVHSCTFLLCRVSWISFIYSPLSLAWIDLKTVWIVWRSGNEIKINQKFVSVFYNLNQFDFGFIFIINFKL